VSESVNERPGILVDGLAADAVAATDRGLHFGDGLFETIAVTGGRPRRWERHMARLRAGCARLGFPAPDAGVCLGEAQALCAGRDRAVLKLIVTRGSGGRGYRPPRDPRPTRIMLCRDWPDTPARIRAGGAQVRFCRTRLGRNPLLAGLKHLNRLEYVLARAEWGDAFDEGLLCDDLGHVVEGTVTNLFAVSQGAIHTPDLSQCGVAGVVRGEIMERAEQLAIPLQVAQLTRDFVEQADELFLTNSLIGVWPVARVEQREHGIGPITRRLMAALTDD